MIGVMFEENYRRYVEESFILRLKEIRRTPSILTIGASGSAKDVELVIIVARSTDFVQEAMEYTTGRCGRFCSAVALVANLESDGVINMSHESMLTPIQANLTRMEKEERGVRLDPALVRGAQDIPRDMEYRVPSRVSVKCRNRLAIGTSPSNRPVIADVSPFPGAAMLVCGCLLEVAPVGVDHLQQTALLDVLIEHAQASAFVPSEIPISQQTAESSRIDIKNSLLLLTFSLLGKTEVADSDLKETYPRVQEEFPWMHQDPTTEMQQLSSLGLIQHTKGRVRILSDSLRRQVIQLSPLVRSFVEG